MTAGDWLVVDTGFGDLLAPVKLKAARAKQRERESDTRVL